MLLGALAGIGTPAFAAAPARSVRPRMRPAQVVREAAESPQSLVEAAQLSGRVSFAVADMADGRVVESRGAAVTHPPASVVKAVTALYALDVLGAQHRFRTRLMATGPLRDGIIDGDLVLVGGGDPGLDSDALGDMGRTLEERGVRGITGAFRVDGAALPAIRAIDPDMPDEAAYNASVSGLNLNFNRVHFGWRAEGAGYAVEMDARAGRYSPRVGMARVRVVDRRSPIYTYSNSGGLDQWTVARRALGREGSRWLPVRSPERYAGDAFRAIAAYHGIALPAADVTRGGGGRGSVLAEHVSPPLREILAGMMRHSTNLTAEVVGLAASRALGGGTGALSDSARRMAQWATERYALARRPGFVDHSGLGPEARVAPAELLQVFVGAGHDRALRAMMSEITPRDADGRARGDSSYTIEAKTGTLYFVSALGGYVTTRRGGELAFVIFTDDRARRAALIEGDDSGPPPGSRAWRDRSRLLQHRLIDRWARVFDA